LLIKVGHIAESEAARRLVAALTPACDALVMVNCVSATVLDPRGVALFGGERRGIAGGAIFSACLRHVEMVREIIVLEASALEVIGVGGICSAQDARRYLAAGCSAVQLATAAMLNPMVGWEIRKALSDGVH